ncbi:hypothetical protein DSO57_1034261 [Entomophthora muscae]|uniref:Uncharacterized protein n=1 Tax=Entomophthora muscae TaxID=34485 RepID=A0ACC2RQU8_9FUNG|nr:hypothetical protein DSO57_1034261 [Entomophthora muscae]
MMVDFPAASCSMGTTTARSLNDAHGQRNVVEATKTWLNRETYGLLIDGAYTRFRGWYDGLTLTQNLTRVNFTYPFFQFIVMN